MEKKNENKNTEFVFEKTILMSGGGNDDPTKFNDAIYNFQRIKLAPTVVFAGFGVIIYAILKK